MKICGTCQAVSDDDVEQCTFDGGALTAFVPGPRVLGERYLLEQKVAAGAMGAVFRAVHLGLGSTVAVKIMRPERDEITVGHARFFREAQILGQIKHPNAVLVMDFDVEKRAGGEIPYLVTEYLRGESLSERMHARGAFSVDESVAIVRAVAAAVHEAHEVGVIHRDIKPSNIFLERLRDGTEIVKVLDFGIAKFIERTPERGERSVRPTSDLDGAPTTVPVRTVPLAIDFEALDEVAEVRGGQLRTRVERMGGVSARNDDGHPSTLTDAGFMIGTIPYMAPEQMTGEPVSRQTDVYAIGSVLFHLLSGRLPFEGADDDIIQSKVADERTHLRELGLEIPDAVDELVFASLALSPDERPKDAKEIGRVLADVAVARKPLSQTPDATALVLKIGALATLVSRTEQALTHVEERPGEDVYAATRDRLLSLSSAVDELSTLATRAKDAAVSDPAIDDELDLLDKNCQTLTRTLADLEHSSLSDYADYLAAVFARTEHRLSVVRGLRKKTTPRPVILPAAKHDPFSPDPVIDNDLVDAIRALEHADALLATDALTTVLDTRREEVGDILRGVRHLDADVRTALLRGLAAHADLVLLRELYPIERPARIMPLLAAVDDEAAAPFRALARVFRGVPEGVSTAHRNIDDALDDLSQRHRDAVWRCLLLHPIAAVRALAAERTPLADVWGVMTWPRTPVSSIKSIFDSVESRGARAEYMKIFFLCAKDALKNATSDDDVEDAFMLLERFFAIPCFHEDVVFEPLLDVDRVLRARTEKGRSQGYDDRWSAFLATGVTDSNAIESLKDIPLPVLRKLARDGHFLSTFVSHPNDRVASETIPHLLRLDDVVRFLRIPTIHKVVVTELARHRRMFRKEAARLALLQNPKTQAPAARLYVPLLPVEQVRLLAENRHISMDVRQVAERFLHKLRRTDRDTTQTRSK